MTTERLYIGLDAGGTKTELLARPALQDDTTTLTGPAANLQRQGLEETARVLTALVRQALSQRPGAALLAVCAGVAGAGSPADQQALTGQFRRLLGEQAPAHVNVVHDGAIALEAAFEGASGVIVVVGTGSVVFARTLDGHLLRAGGWGYLFGDEGSGHVLGVQGLRAVAAAFDGGPATRLQPLLAERYGLDTPDALKHSVYRDGWPVQQMAPLVIEAAEQGDGEARRIISEQTQALARQVQWLAHRSGAIAPRLALLGGLSRSASYQQALSGALLDALPGWGVQEPLHPPVVGALRLAMGAASS